MSLPTIEELTDRMEHAAAGYVLDSANRDQATRTARIVGAAAVRTMLMDALISDIDQRSKGPSPSLNRIEVHRLVELLREQKEEMR